MELCQCDSVSYEKILICHECKLPLLDYEEKYLPSAGLAGCAADSPSVGMKLCPFCGSDSMFVERIHLSSYAVQCNKCLATGPLTDEDENKDEHDQEQDAMEIWNRRV